MAVELISDWKVYGSNGRASVTVNASSTSQSWNAPQERSGSGDRLVPANPGRWTAQHLVATPRVTGYLTRDNILTITKIEAIDIYFEYDPHGHPIGNKTWSMHYMGYYVRQAAGGWHWTNVYTWTDSYYYSVVHPYQRVNISNKVVWEGSTNISWGDTWTVDFIYSETGSESPGVSTISIKNTYTKPANSKPTLSPSCKANTSNGNTINFNGGGSWGYCDNQNNTSSYKIYDNAAMKTPIKSGSGYSATVSGLSPNTRYWASFTKSNGCFSVSATCEAVTVTPNSLSNATPVKFDTATVRLAVTNGGGEYNPSTQIQIKKCSASAWTNAATSTTKSVATITLDGLEAETCYQVRALTTTPAGTYTGNVVSFTTPKKGLCIAEFTKIEPGMNEKTYEATVDMCYKWETTKVPATIVVRYQVKDGYDKTWYESETITVNELTGTYCFTLGNLYPNQTVYQTYIHTETEEATYDSPMSEFITAVIPEPDIHNCQNFEYLTELLCQSVKKLLSGNKTIYANPYSQALCDPYNEDPTSLTLWSRALRLFHAMYCLVCDMGGSRLTASKPGQYLVGEAGWQDIITIINENADDENWKLATSNAIWKYIQDKLHEVWHYHDKVDVLVYDLADLDKYPDATSAILTSENAIYRKVSGAWKKSTDKADQIDPMGVWHINMESSTQAGYVQPGSAWYYWEGNWQPLDADVIAFAKIVDTMWEKKDQAVYNETGADRLHIAVTDRNQFDCTKLPSGERWVTMITEPLSVPAPGYYEIAFETGAEATIIQTQQVLAGALAQRPEDPTRPGYIFEEWHDKATGALYNWASPVHKNITIEAIWTPQPVTVTFDIGEATGTAPATITTVYGATINPLPTADTFSLAGATFLGWQRDGVPFGASTIVVGDTILKPRWSMDEFDVTIHTENSGPNQVVHLSYGNGLAQPATPTKPDSVFVGWFTSPTASTGAPFEFDTPLFGATDVYARWVPATYTVSFDSAGGSAVPSQTVAYRAFATQPTSPTKAGVVFGYWMKNGQHYYFNEQIIQDTNLVANWLNVYTIKFVDSFGDTVAPDRQAVEGSPFGVSLPAAPDRAGYTFDGWYGPDGHKIDGAIDTVTSDMTVTAVYTKN